MEGGKDVKAVLKSYQIALKYAKKAVMDWDEAELNATTLRSPKMDGMPRVGGVHGLELQVAVVEEKRATAEKERKMAFDVLDKIEAMIDSLDDFEQRNVLRKRYIDGMEWAEVAKETFMSERKVYNVHGRALTELRKRWEE